jgi:hypothetical protein
VQAGLKHAGFSMLTVAVDVQGLPVPEKATLLKEMGKIVLGFADAFGSTQTLSLRVDAADKIKASATLLCADARSAVAVREVVDAARVAFKDLLKDDAEHAPRDRAMKQLLRAVLDEVKVATNGTQVNAEVVIEAATAIQLLRSTMDEKKPVPEFKKR